MSDQYEAAEAGALRPVTLPIESEAPAASERGLRALLAVTREALTSAERDYTTGPIGRAVILLAIPMVLEMAMESLFAICDVFFVSRLGVDAVAAVGLTEAVMTILYSIAGGIGMAVTALVARRIGEKRPDEAVTVTVQAIAVGVAISLLVGIPGGLLAPRLLRLMGAPPAVAEVGAGYVTVLLGASFTVVLLFMINAAFRGAGDAALAMRTLWLANTINLVLDPCLIFGLGPFPEMGLTGAAVATAIGRGVGILYQLAALARGRGQIRVVRAQVRVRLDVIGQLLRVSVGGTMQYLVATASWVALVRIVGGFGAAAVAGYTIAIRIILFALLPSWGLAGSAATLMGQNLGAGRPERAERSVWIAGGFNTVFLLAVAVLFIATARPLVGLFTADEETLRLGAQCLRWVAYGYGFYGLGMVIVQAFNGAGDTATPTWINLGCYWMFQIPLAYVLAYRVGLSALGAFIAIPVAESVVTIVAVLVFRRGRWKNVKV
jgi:putative MATE family efflux protein